MNKWQIICPLAALGLVVVLLAPRLIRNSHMRQQELTAERILSVARDLETKTNSASLDRMPVYLHQALEQFLTTPTAYRETVRSGDEPPPLGNGSATHRLYLRNSDNQFLALRLQYQPALQKFHVLGFWHPTAWPGHTLPSAPARLANAPYQ